MPDDERRRLLGRRQGRSGPDPADALTWVVIFLIGGVGFVYVLAFGRVAFDSDFEPPPGVLTALLAVIPIASGIVLLRRNGNGK